MEAGGLREKGCSALTFLLEKPKLQVEWEILGRSRQHGKSPNSLSRYFSIITSGPAQGPLSPAPDLDFARLTMVVTEVAVERVLEISYKGEEEMTKAEEGCLKA